MILSSKPWNSSIAERLARRLDRHVEIVSCPEQLRTESIAEINPQWIFVPHWSYLIPESVWGRWPTVIFHMTDLPYGRGGSPLQNLIQHGHVTTMLTALRCCKELDAGDVYLKEPLDLHGSAEEIFLKADKLIEKMIERIVHERPKAKPQHGNPVLFTRRTPAQSNLSLCTEGELSAWYDQIRMLDAAGYPHAFLEVNGMRLEFRRVSQRSDGLYADVRISSTATVQTPKQEPSS
ncbi:methionyl-tRNA formyltransferase [Synechococcus sp. UW69]|uniref:methionyl-tRNA formyltransferase n=1 Tax=Synechococcus sp. UW69 TaxID=368493 RepID=UPI0018E0A866|nr:methionyl-tRNA formyltransferase [Synechococcus sp. UW69]